MLIHTRQANHPTGVGKMDRYRIGNHEKHQPLGAQASLPATH
jgi:hypothetical protein